MANNKHISVKLPLLGAAIAAAALSLATAGCTLVSVNPPVDDDDASPGDDDDSASDDDDSAA